MKVAGTEETSEPYFIILPVIFQFADCSLLGKKRVFPKQALGSPLEYQPYMERNSQNSHNASETHLPGVGRQTHQRATKSWGLLAEKARLELSQACRWKAADKSRPR